MWDLERAACCARWKATLDWVNGVAVTADGRRAVSASWDNTLKVWDLDAGHALRTLEGHSDLGPCGGGDGGRQAGGLRLMRQDPEGVGPGDAGSALRTLEGHSDWVAGVAVTADGRRAVSASWDKTLKVWDLETGACCARSKATLDWCRWRGGDGGRAAGGLRVPGQHAEGVGPGDRPRAAHAGRPL